MKPCRIVRKTILKIREPEIEINQYKLVAERRGRIISGLVDAKSIVSIQLYKTDINPIPEKTFDVPDYLK